jgi:hypothetical protein
LWLQQDQEAIHDFKKAMLLDPALTEENYSKIDEILKFSKEVSMSIQKRMQTAQPRDFKCEIPSQYQLSLICGFKDLSLNESNAGKIFKVRVFAEVGHIFHRYIQIERVNFIVRI